MRAIIRSITWRIFMFLVVAWATSAAPAGAETVNCSAITSVPMTISTPGIYCFTGDLVTNLAAGNAITIAADNVVLDLNGRRLDNSAAGPSTFASGVYAVAQQSVTVRNGTVRGFLFGILLQDTSSGRGYVIETIHADRNWFVGLQAEGTGNVIRNNRVTTTGSSTQTGFTNGNAFGISGLGAESRILNNEVADTVGTAGGGGFGIDFFNASDGLAVANRITQADTGLVYLNGSTGKFRDNITSGVTTPYDGGTDIGNNF